MIAVADRASLAKQDPTRQRAPPARDPRLVKDLRGIQDRRDAGRPRSPCCRRQEGACDDHHVRGVLLDHPPKELAVAAHVASGPPPSEEATRHGERRVLKRVDVRNWGQLCSHRPITGHEHDQRPLFRKPFELPLKRTGRAAGLAQMHDRQRPERAARRCGCDRMGADVRFHRRLTRSRPVTCEPRVYAIELLLGRPPNPRAEPTQTDDQASACGRIVGAWRRT